MTSSNELFNWYLAYLRKSAHSRTSADMMTPMALVKADADMLKDLIKADLGKQKEKPPSSKTDKAKDEKNSELSKLETSLQLIFDFCPQLLCKLDSDGQILELNHTANNFLSNKSSPQNSRSIFNFLDSQSKQNLRKSLERCKKHNEFEEIELLLQINSDDYKDLRWRSEWSGTANAFFCLAEDISAEKNVERMKNEMNMMINHDLRAPVNALSMWVDNAISGVHGEFPERTVNSLKRTSENLKGILQLLDCLLDAEKLEAGTMKANPVTFKIEDVLMATQKMFQELSQSRGVSVLVEPTDSMVFADAFQVGRILNNFCSNAIYYSPSGCIVKLRARPENDKVTIEVEDEGPGIAAEVQETLFQRWSATTSNQKQTPSSGLGLYISRKLAELQGGTTGAKNKESKGSIFWLSLPTSRK